MAVRPSGWALGLLLAAAAAMLALLAPSAAAQSRCVGLACDGLATGDDVSELGSAPRAVSGLDELTAQTESGFYDVPAPLYQGNVQPRAVVYLSLPGQVRRMPASVRNLDVVRDLDVALGSELNSVTLVVIDRGARHLVPDSSPAAARRRPRVQAAHPEPWRGCGDRYFCLYPQEGWGGAAGKLDLYGPVYYGTGWWNLTGGSYNNWAESMVNHRDNGDSLLADGSNGAGTRYCARQHSEDETFSGNALGNNQASSFALLGSDVDRC